jgi:hypothetical protein
LYSQRPERREVMTSIIPHIIITTIIDRVDSKQSIKLNGAEMSEIGIAIRHGVTVTAGLLPSEVSDDLSEAQACHYDAKECDAQCCQLVSAEDGAGAQLDVAQGRQHKRQRDCGDHALIHTIIIL